MFYGNSFLIGPTSLLAEVPLLCCDTDKGGDNKVQCKFTASAALLLTQFQHYTGAQLYDTDSSAWPLLFSRQRFLHWVSLSFPVRFLPAALGVLASVGASHEVSASCCASASCVWPVFYIYVDSLSVCVAHLLWMCY